MMDEPVKDDPPPYSAVDYTRPPTQPATLQHTSQYRQTPSIQYGLPPPPYGQPQYNQSVFHVQYPQPNVVGAPVVISQPGLVGVPCYGPSPCTLKCPQCSAEITTSTSRTCGGMVWMVAGIICLLGLFFPCLWLGFCFIPFCIPSLYDVRHTCPNCQRLLGTYSQQSGSYTNCSSG